MANIFVGTEAGVFAVEGNGPSQVLESAEVRDLVLIGGRIFASTGAGVYLSDDNGENWLPSGIESRQVWQIRAFNEEILFAVTQPMGLFRSDDGGKNWKEVKSFASMPQASKWCLPLTPPIAARARAIVVDKDDVQKMWVGVEVGGIVKTEDGGENWDIVLPGENPDLHVLCVQPNDRDVLYASTGYGRLDGIATMTEGNAGVFRSDDRGSTWKYAWHGITPRYSRPMCIDQRSPHELTVACAPTAFSSFTDEGGAGAMLLRSQDGGNSWASLCDEDHSPSAANIHGLAVDSECPGGVLVGMDNGEVWKVSKDCQWEMLAEDLPAVVSILTF